MRAAMLKLSEASDPFKYDKISYLQSTMYVVIYFFFNPTNFPTISMVLVPARYMSFHLNFLTSVLFGNPGGGGDTPIEEKLNILKYTDKYGACISLAKQFGL
jgi:hypothetical protein